MKNGFSSTNEIKLGALLGYVVIILNTLVSLFYTPYMLRQIGQSEYGLYSLVSSLIAYLTILDVGMGNAIVRYTAKFRAQGKLIEQYKMFGMFFILYLVIGAIAFIIGLFLYGNVDLLFNSTMTLDELSKAKVMILLLIFNLAFSFPMSIWGSIMTAYERFVFPKVINIIRLFLNTFLMVFLLSKGHKAITMTVVTTIFNVLTLVINYCYCKYSLHVKLIFDRFNWDLLKEVAVYSFWIFLNIIMDKIYWGTGQFVLGSVASVASVAIFAIAIHLQSMYMQFSTALSGLLLPKLTALAVSKGTDKEISDLFIKTGRLQYIILSFILLGFIVFGKQFILMWAGPEYEESYIIALLLLVPLTIPLIQNVGITILQARNQMKFRSILYVIIAMSSLFFQIYYAKSYGGIGCASAISVALIIGHVLIMNIYYSKKQNIDILKFWKEILKMSIVPWIFLAISLYVQKYINISNWVELFTGIAIFTVVYIPIFYVFSMNQYEKILVKLFLKKIHIISR